MLIYPKYAKDINHKNKFLKKIIDIQLFINKINITNGLINYSKHFKLNFCFGRKYGNRKNIYDKT